MTKTKLTNQKRLTASIALALIIAGAAGCSKPAQTAALPHTLLSAPVIAEVSADKPSISATASTAIEATIVLNKPFILSTEFLYGADLQYSSYHDPGFDLYNQSLAIGHIPAKFRIVGSELQLYSDDVRLFPSDVNHPEQLISRFDIKAETGDTLTVAVARSGIFLSQLFEATRKPGKGSLTIPSAAGPKDTWVRSFEYAAEDHLILQQTSVQLADGSLAEFAESLFPRARIQPGAQFKSFEMIPDDAKSPTGGDGDLKRFMLLKGEKNFNGEKEQTFAQHFDISGGATIDWYVTRNIPEEYVPTVAQAVEGWNRYFRSYKGIARDVVKFKGRLPEGVHLGDPRFNVINWDSRIVAGAAYESQANDPATGKQSHSLIYMPAAWVKIGLDYWKNGIASDSLAHPQGLARVARRACDLDMGEAAGLLASGRVSSEQAIKEFGLRLLKGTLHHEVGHSLGLGHDFKGSLAFDRANPKSLPTDSIMDYNDYEIERAVFPDLNSSDGPLLEYDRQALSFIYDQGADIAPTDPVLPACNDAIADNLDGGVDPLCVRYDIEKDPTLSVVTAFKRATEEKLDGDVSLAQAVRNVPALALKDAAITAVKTEKDLQDFVKGYAAALQGPLGFYLVTGKASVGKVVRTNLRVLLQYADNVLPASIDELAFRERVFNGVQQTLALRDLPATLAAPLEEGKAALAQAIARTPFFVSIEPSKAQDLVKAALAKLDESFKGFAKDSDNGLPKLRALLLAALSNQKKALYFAGPVKGASGERELDYQTAILGILADVAGDAGNRTEGERVAAATSLVSFKTIAPGADALEAVIRRVSQEALAAKTVDARSTSYAVLAALKEIKDGGDDQ